MIELWGADSCVACGQAKMLLQKTPLEWRYVDVKNTGFEGRIPRLILEDGTPIIDLPQITGYIKNKLREMGFPEGIL